MVALGGSKRSSEANGRTTKFQQVLVCCVLFGWYSLCVIIS